MRVGLRPDLAGGGWFLSPQGAYRKQRLHAGSASFSFVSAAHPGAGPMTLKFHVADMDFRSTGYDTLWVAGSRAQYQGSGTLNGKGNYQFLLTAVDMPDLQPEPAVAHRARGADMRAARPTWSITTTRPPIGTWLPPATAA